MIYDDKCYVCVKFAKLMNFLAKGKLRMIGHYTEFGEKIREEILEDDALEMFWFIDKRNSIWWKSGNHSLIIRNSESSRQKIQ